MALLLISTPRRADTPLGAVSDVAAGLTQLPYYFERQDFPVVSSTDLGGFQNIRASGDLSAELVAGQALYLHSAIIPPGRATIYAFEYFVGTNETTIQISFPWTVNCGAGYVDLLDARAGYTVLIEPVDAISGADFLPYPESYKPRESGQLFVNIINLLVLVRFDGVAINYRLRYSERWGGITRNTQTDEAVFAIAAKKQLLDVGGSNMWEFLFDVTNHPGQLMTKFKTPVTWLGWFTRISGIVDSNLGTRTTSSEIGAYFTPRDINGASVGADIRLMVNLTGQPFIYSEVIPESLKLVENVFYLETRFINEAFIVLSQRSNIVIKKPCQNPIMLEWLNGNGVSENWLFERMQDVNNEALEGSIYEKTRIAPIDQVNDTLNRLTAGNIQRITLFAEQLTLDQVRALHEIKTSLSLWLWLDQTGAKKIKVVVDNLFNTSINTKAKSHEFGVSIRLPLNFDFYK